MKQSSKNNTLNDVIPLYFYFINRNGDNVKLTEETEEEFFEIMNEYKKSRKLQKSKKRNNNIEF